MLILVLSIQQLETRTLTRGRLSAFIAVGIKIYSSLIKFSKYVCDAKGSIVIILVNNSHVCQNAVVTKSTPVACCRNIGQLTDKWCCCRDALHWSQTRTGLDDDGSGIFAVEHSLQNIAPQLRQWCCRIHQTTVHNLAVLTKPFTGQCSRIWVGAVWCLCSSPCSYWQVNSTAMHRARGSTGKTERCPTICITCSLNRAGSKTAF